MILKKVIDKLDIVFNFYITIFSHSFMCLCSVFVYIYYMYN